MIVAAAAAGHHYVSCRWVSKMGRRHVCLQRLPPPPSLALRSACLTHLQVVPAQQHHAPAKVDVYEEKVHPQHVVLELDVGHCEAHEAAVAGVGHARDAPVPVQRQHCRGGGAGGVGWGSVRGAHAHEAARRPTQAACQKPVSANPPGGPGARLPCHAWLLAGGRGTFQVAHRGFVTRGARAGRRQNRLCGWQVLPHTPRAKSTNVPCSLPGPYSPGHPAASPPPPGPPIP